MMGFFDYPSARTLDSVLDSFEEYVNEVGISKLDLSQFVTNWQRTHGSQLDREAYLELLRVWMEYEFQSGNVISVEQALTQFPEVEFDESARRVLEFEKQRLESTWSVRGSGSPHQHASLPVAPGSWEDFDLVAELGEGAFARVFLARQKSMASRLVALKITPRKTRESQWLARLQHSAVVPIYSVHQFGEFYGVCMPYLGNTTLADLLGEQKRASNRRQFSAGSEANGLVTNEQSEVALLADGKALLQRLRFRQSELNAVVRRYQTAKQQIGSVGDESDVTSGWWISSGDDSVALAQPSEVHERTSTARELANLNYVESVVWIGAQLTNALEHAHRLGIIHCDIKPANVLLAADGQPRLLDFNVAQESAAVQRVKAEQNRGLIGGSPGYMAPEQVRLLRGEQDSTLDGRVDIYALGAVLFELLTGRRPEISKIQDSRRGAVIEQSLKKLNGDVSPALAAIVSKCLAYDRENRYRSATELYDDLNAQLHHRPLIHQLEPSFLERARKWRRRHPNATSVGSVSTIAVVLLLTVVTWAMSLRESRRLMALALDQNSLEAVLTEAIPRISAAHEYHELHDAVLKDVQVISDLLSRLSPQPLNSDGLRELLPESTCLKVLTYVKLFQACGHAASGGLSGADAKDGARGLDLKGKWELPTELATLSSLEFDDLKIPQLYEAFIVSDFNEVIEHHRRGDGLVETDFARWLFVGHSFMRLEQWADASEAYTHALAIEPNLAIARFYRGISRMKAERWREAAEDFAATKSQQPTFMEARFNLAQVHKRLDNLRVAEAELSEAIDLGWSSVMGFYTRATIRKRLGEVELAKQDYEAALRQPPRSEADWLQLGLIALRSAPEKAETYFRETIRRFPNSRIAGQNLAHVLSESLGRPEESIQVLTELINEGAASPELYSGRAVLYGRLGLHDKSLADLHAAENLNPVAPVIQYQIACGYSLLASLAAGHGQADVTDGVIELRDSAVSWFCRAVRADLKLGKLAIKDPDLNWLRGQEEFSVIQRALATINMTAKNE